jgi:ABC-type antimicrobial peptide transport system permease subunit
MFFIVFVQIHMMRCVGIPPFSIVRLFIEEAYILVGTAIFIGTGMYVCMYLYVYVCMYLSMYVCMHVCMYVFAFI